MSTQFPLRLHDKDEIERCLRRDPSLHLYELGDLDDFFWPYTTWYGLKQDNRLTQTALIYDPGNAPILLALTSSQSEEMCSLVASLIPYLPQSFYTHLSSGVEQALTPNYQLISHGLHYKMSLHDHTPITQIGTSEVIQLTPQDMPAIKRLYEASYPGNWFDARMLETHRYYGVRINDEIVSIAGIHVYSPRYRVATLGNVTTHPAYRGQGLSTKVCARLCEVLAQEVDHVGLNVKADNSSAIGLYKRLGFEIVAEYGEFVCEAVRREKSNKRCAFSND